MSSEFLALAGGEVNLAQWHDAFAVGDLAVAVRGPRAFMAHDEKACVALVGELHNASEVARALGLADDAPFTGASLVMRAWQRWGDRALDRLVGSFAGAFLDVATRRLAVFRDLTAGVPTYLSRLQGTFIAGNDLGRVAGWNGRRLVPSELFIASYLQNQNVCGTATAFEGVESLAPGSVASPVERASWRQRPVARWRVTPVRHRTPAEYVDEFADQLDAAVLRRIQGHTTAAVALSGGLDSTNVLAAGVRVAPHVEWIGYSIPFHDARGDERELQKLVASHCGARIVWVDIGRRGPIGCWSGVLLADKVAPPWGGNWFFGDAIAEGASSDGVPIMFDGEDADSLLSGSRGYLADLLARGQWLTWRREAKRLRAHAGADVRNLLKSSAVSLLPPAVIRRASSRSGDAGVSALVAPALAARAHLAERLRAQTSSNVWSPGRRFAAQQRLTADPVRLGEVVTEVGASYRTAEIIDAHPFFDRQLMSYCMGLPWQMVHGGTRPKLLLRELAKRRLPETFNQNVRKANLGQYYEAAVYGWEREVIVHGLDLAAERPEWIAPVELARLRQALDDEADAWMPSRLAMLMLWVDQLQAAAASGCA